jgi:hypothetical protein
MGFELREIENRVREFVTERLRYPYEQFSVSREGLEFLRDELEKRMSDLGARVREFRVNTVFTPHDTIRVEARTSLTIKLDVKGQRVECYTDIPIRSALVSAKLKDSSYDADFIVTPGGRPPIVRCYTAKE